jgi:hypothetical protein
MNTKKTLCLSQSGFEPNSNVNPKRDVEFEKLHLQSTATDPEMQIDCSISRSSMQHSLGTDLQREIQHRHRTATDAAIRID